MIVEDFNELKTNTLVYGGKSGQKLGVIINGDNWFLKFPKSTKRFSFRHVQLVSESQSERQFDDANVQRLQYVDKEE